MDRAFRRQCAPNDKNDDRQHTPRRPHAQLLPTLFDRLRDDEPMRGTEAPGEYTVTRAQMRQIIQRDLGFLLNTVNMNDFLDHDRDAHATASTINYGVPSLAGSYLSEHQWEEIEKHLRRAIFDFEPRLMRETLQIVPLMKDGATHRYNVLLFEIRGTVRMDPYPMAFTVQSSVDLETNRMSISAT